MALIIYTWIQLLESLCQSGLTLLHPVKKVIQKSWFPDQQREDGVIDILVGVICFQAYLSYIIMCDVTSEVKKQQIPYNLHS